MHAMSEAVAVGGERGDEAAREQGKEWVEAGDVGGDRRRGDGEVPALLQRRAGELPHGDGDDGEGNGRDPVEDTAARGSGCGSAHRPRQRPARSSWPAR